MEPKGWYNRGYLPHFDDGTVTQSITCSLFDAIPARALQELREELALLTVTETEMIRRLRLEAILDRGEGSRKLSVPCLAELVQNTLLFFDGERYVMHAWVIMPTHFHALFTQLNSFPLEKIMHSWKSYTSSKANELLSRKGHFWMSESYDRYIRDEQHFNNVVAYIENSPVKAGLCRAPEEWRWSSAWGRTGKDACAPT